MMVCNGGMECSAARGDCPRQRRVAVLLRITCGRLHARRGGFDRYRSLPVRLLPMRALVKLVGKKSERLHFGCAIARDARAATASAQAARCVPRPPGHFLSRCVPCLRWLPACHQRPSTHRRRTRRTEPAPAVLHWATRALAAIAPRMQGLS